MVETNENYKPVLRLTITDFISVNHYLAYRVIMKNGKPMAMSYKTQEVKSFQKKFQEYIKEQVKIQNWNLPVDPAQHFYVDAVFYFPRLDLDPNNYFKVSLDTITETGLIWADDNVVCERVQRIYYDSSNPRIEMTVYPVDYIGIFDNKVQLDEFESKCKTCSRYARNCSILKKAKEGRIQEEIQNLECSKYKGIK